MVAISLGNTVGGFRCTEKLTEYLNNLYRKNGGKLTYTRWTDLGNDRYRISLTNDVLVNDLKVELKIIENWQAITPTIFAKLKDKKFDLYIDEKGHHYVAPYFRNINKEVNIPKLDLPKDPIYKVYK
jgi:hypothetical protein